jgi:hypothetical protein
MSLNAKTDTKSKNKNQSPNINVVTPKNNSMVHVIPINDIDYHEQNEFCHCNPTINEDGVCVHNAFDGREVFEQAKEQIENPISNN